MPVTDLLKAILTTPAIIALGSVLGIGLYFVNWRRVKPGKVIELDEHERKIG